MRQRLWRQLENGAEMGRRRNPCKHVAKSGGKVDSGECGVDVVHVCIFVCVN